jgi:HEAT repeat protein
MSHLRLEAPTEHRPRRVFSSRLWPFAGTVVLVSVLALYSAQGATPVPPTSAPVTELMAEFRGGSEDARIGAASQLLGIVGDPRARAVLIRALRGSDGESYDVVRDAIDDDPTGALPFLESMLREKGKVKDTAISILGELRREAGPAVPDLIALLHPGRAGENDVVAGALSDIGDPAIDPLIARLSSEPALLPIVVPIFTEMAAKELGPESQGKLVRLFQSQIRLPCEEICRSAIEGLSNLGPAAAAAWSDLMRLLDPAHNAGWSLAAEALGKIRAHPDETVRMLRSLLPQPIEQSLGAITALGDFGPAAASAVPDLEQLLATSNNEVTQQNVAETLGRIGAAATPATATLVAAFARANPETRRSVAEALDRIADALPQVAPGYSDRTVNDLVEELAQAKQMAASSADIDGNPNTHGSTVATYDGGIHYLEAVLHARRVARQKALALRVAVGLGLATIALSMVLTARVRWALLTLIGRRWSFVIGSCTATAEVSGREGRLRLVQDASPIAMPLDLSRIDDVALAQVPVSLPKGSTLLVVADQEAFRNPWAHALGNGWSMGADAIIAGQICLARELSTSRSRERKLQFQAIGCAEAPGRPALQAVAEELTSVARHFHRWGAHVLPLGIQASKTDLAEALTSVDVLHIAAHANGSGIELADGVFDKATFTERVGTKLRCRLLILSGCEAGRLSDDHAFVYELVQRGTNVVASVETVRDSTCLALFDALYRALLPRRQAQGIELAAAIRQAGAECARRFAAAERTLQVNPGPSLHWKRSLDAFILYGDPSVRLALLTGFR